MDQSSAPLLPALPPAIMTALWSGHPDTARGLLAKERSARITRINELARQLQIEQENLRRLEASLPPDMRLSGGDAADGAARLAAPIPYRAPNARERLARREQVLAVARPLAAEGEFSIRQLVAALQAAAVDLKVPSNMVNTAVGNIIYRCEEFEFVREGVYRTRRKVAPQGRRKGLNGAGHHMEGASA